MLYLTLYLFFVIAVIGVGFLSGMSDINGMKIPNILSVLVVAGFVGAYAVCYFAGTAEEVFSDIWKHVAAAVIMFVVTYMLFFFKIMGAGDSKLATAYGLWIGFAGIPAFLFYMTLVGGLLGIASIVIRKSKPFKNVKEGGWIGRTQAGESVVPYGVAIFFGAVASFVYLDYLGGDVVNLFLA